MSDLRDRLRIDEAQLRAINDFLLDPGNEVVNRFLEVVDRYGTPEEIKADVHRVKNLLGPNLIVSPSHEALLPNVPPQNVQAMAEAALEM